MTYSGHVENGVIVLDEVPTALPEGTKVRVELVTAEQPRRTIAERLQNIIGKAEGLPPDASISIDDRLYGRVSE